MGNVIRVVDVALSDEEIRIVMCFPQGFHYEMVGIN